MSIVCVNYKDTTKWTATFLIWNFDYVGMTQNRNNVSYTLNLHWFFIINTVIKKIELTIDSLSIWCKWEIKYKYYFTTNGQFQFYELLWGLYNHLLIIVSMVKNLYFFHGVSYPYNSIDNLRFFFRTKLFSSYYANKSLDVSDNMKEE